MIGTNLYEFIPQTPLQFQEGDIFGVYSDRTDGNRLVLYEQRETGPINLRISPSLNSPPSTITQMLITVNNDFPLVTVEISMHFIIFKSNDNSYADTPTHSFVMTFTSVMEKSQVAAITSISVSHSLFSTHSLCMSYFQFQSIMSPSFPPNSPSLTLAVSSKCIHLFSDLFQIL